MDDAHRGIVADHGEVGGERLRRSRRPARGHRRASPHGRLRAGEHGGSAGVVGSTARNSALRLRDAPAAPSRLQREVDDADMAAPEARHHGRHAGERPARGVDARDPGEIRARQQQMLMADEDRVDAAELRPARGRRSRPRPPAPIFDMPAWQSATTRSAPAARQAGTCARAASTMPIVVTRPARWLMSQRTICGVTKPMTPIVQLALAAVAVDALPRRIVHGVK